MHILLLPGVLLALIGVHLGLVWYQKHTQYPGPGRTEGNVVGVRILPVFAAKGGAFFAIVAGVLIVMGGVFQINPIWNFGPYNPAQISAGSQPDFYMGWSDGMARLFPAWEIVLGNWRIPAVFWASIGFLPVIFILAILYPGIERKMTGDNALHNLLQRPRDVPVRTALGMMSIAFYMVLLMSSANDWFAFYFDISLNATTWMGRIGLLIVPPIAYWVTYRLCLGLQKADRAVLEHGLETGIVRRLPHGEFIEVHQPLAGVDAHGHPIPLEYQGAPVPKKMNQLGFGGQPVPGSLLTPDPADETVALEQARAEEARAEEAQPDRRSSSAAVLTRTTEGHRGLTVRDRAAPRAPPTPRRGPRRSAAYAPGARVVSRGDGHHHQHDQEQHQVGVREQRDQPGARDRADPGPGQRGDHRGGAEQDHGRDDRRPPGPRPRSRPVPEHDQQRHEPHPVVRPRERGRGRRTQPDQRERGQLRAAAVPPGGHGQRRGHQQRRARPGTRPARPSPPPAPGPAGRSASGWCSPRRRRCARRPGTCRPTSRCASRPGRAARPRPRPRRTSPARWPRPATGAAPAGSRRTAAGSA